MEDKKQDTKTLEAEELAKAAGGQTADVPENDDSGLRVFGSSLQSDLRSTSDLGRASR